jgi:hypothetical protein
MSVKRFIDYLMEREGGLAVGEDTPPVPIMKTSRKKMVV